MPLSEEDVAALRADLEKVQREKEATQADLERVQREKEATDAENRDIRRSWTGFGEKGRWAHLSTGNLVVVQLIFGELLPRLWVPCGHVG